jgi:ectoine hydroxylase
MNATAARKTTTDELDPYYSRILTAPEIGARVDPVVHTGIEGPLSQHEVAFYDEHGYLQLDARFIEAELLALRQESAHLLSGDAKLLPETLIREPDSDTVRSAFHIHEQSALVRRLVRDSRVLGAARQLLGDESYIHQSRLNYKSGFSGKDFYWHSDFETWHMEDGMPRMRALSMSIALTENTEYNGPLMIMPGSHRSYVRCMGKTPEDHYKASLRRQEYGVPDHDSLNKLYNEGGIVAPKGAAGTIVIFDCNIMHGSNSNISPLPRSNIFLVFNSVHNVLTSPYAGTKPRPEFIAVRNDTSALQPVSGQLS